jgi:hypothetical protein
VSKNKYGYVSVDLRIFGYKNEPFIFANNVEQVFYVPVLAKKNWFMVMLEKRIVGVENVVVEEEYNQFDEIPSFDTTSLMRINQPTSPLLWERYAKPHTHIIC